MKRSTLALSSLLLFTAVILNSCALNNQARQIKALEECTYRIVDVNEITVAGVDFNKIFKDEEINLSAIPSIALGLLTKDVPLKSKVLLEITNPSQQTAAINEFEYIVQIGREEIANGRVEVPVTVEAGQSKTIPIQLNTNIHRLISNKELVNQMLEAYTKRSSNASLGELTIKLKPTFKLGQSSFKYPGYINIRKNLDLNKLFNGK